MIESEPCPCCGFLTFAAGSTGSFEICEVCFWERDPLQDERPNYSGGANKVSLNEARENFLAFGATEERVIKYVRPPRPEELPGGRW